ncbi:hypothetical protein [Chloroflexus sp.]|uniref:hypothetical protein n=1 Tax=Chloroflexus sp. TaxID=1904827 RepID=UPI002ACDADF6|nr:hypothetical protein [Chloroflexus sp.]
MLVPGQEHPSKPVEWKAIRLTESDGLAVRAMKRLRSDDLLAAELGATMLRNELDRVPLWRGNHVAIRQLIDDFARYLYLQRVDGPEVIARAIQNGVGSLTWQSETFVYAERYDEATGRYLGLRCGESIAIRPEDRGLVVKPDIAHQQRERETQREPVPPPDSYQPQPPVNPRPAASGTVTIALPLPKPAARRFHGSVRLDPARVGRDASRIAEEVVAHLAALANADVTVTLEIEARLPDGFSEQTIRIVSENSRVLKFEQAGFAEE